MTRLLALTALQALIVLALVAEMSAARADPPRLYRQAAFQSPVSGDPDDLLLLAGDGLASGDEVIYRLVPDTAESVDHPYRVPRSSDGQLGVAPVVSAADAPYALAIRLPPEMRTGETYALWVRSPAGEWSAAVKINDARPLWASPAYAYASLMPGSLPRELKIVGRNLQKHDGAATRVRLSGRQSFVAAAIADPQPSSILDEHVVRIALPDHIAPDHYRVQVSRAGAPWVTLEGQRFEVLPDPPAPAQFSISDPRFGGCHPDDDVDDTACVQRAIDAAARAGGGVVYFPPGTWDLIDRNQRGVAGDEGILVPLGVGLRGAGRERTRINRHAEWNSGGTAAAAFTLLGQTLVTGFTFRDLKMYGPDDRAGPFLQLGENRRRVESRPAGSAAASTGITIAHNAFDKTFVAIGSGGPPIERLIIAYNTFGAYRSALELSGEESDVVHEFRLDDSVIDHNTFAPSSLLDSTHKVGPLASEVGAGHRVDFSGNAADGASTEYLYSPQDPRGWRAAFFWNLSGNVEEVLVSQNSASCTGDKIGDGEAISFDNNTNTFAFTAAAPVVRAGDATVAVSVPLAARQHGGDVPLPSYYLGHWIQIVSGPGLGQARKIIGYSTDPSSHVTTFVVAPAFDVVPAVGRSRITIGREYWQLYVLDNEVDNRTPLCQKSNRSRRVAGAIELWGQSVDSVIGGNEQFDSDGILVQQVYATPEHPCPDCTMYSFFHSFLDIRRNIVDGEYDWDNDCSHSGIGLGLGAATWVTPPPPVIGFGVSISHNIIRHADAENGGAIAQFDSWSAGPEPHRWPLADSTLIHHNEISDIAGAEALPVCGKSRHPRMGIAFPEHAVAWHTVLYANACKNVSTPIGDGGVDLVEVCPSPVPNSCECPDRPLHPVRQLQH
jgi:hypothetical protein